MVRRRFLSELKENRKGGRRQRSMIFTSVCVMYSLILEPRCEKTGLRGFRQGPTRTGLYSHGRRLVA